jgi:integral membrane protein
VNDAIRTAFRRYQIMAWLVGSFLAFMALIALPLKYLASTKIPGYAIGWQIHGFLFMAYLLATADLGVKARWHVGKLIVTAVLGTIPLMSFFAERKLRKEFV